MKHLSNINRNYNCWNRFGKEYTVWDVFMYFCLMSLFLMQPTIESLWIRKLAKREKIEPTKYSREKKLGPTKYPREKYLDQQNIHLEPRNTHEKKFWTHETPTRINVGPTKYPWEKNLDQQNTHEKKFWIHETPTGKNFEPTKYQREKILDPRNTHEKYVWTHQIPMRKTFGTTKYLQRHDGTIALDPRDPQCKRPSNLA